MVDAKFRLGQDSTVQLLYIFPSLQLHRLSYFYHRSTTKELTSSATPGGPFSAAFLDFSRNFLSSFIDDRGLSNSKAFLSVSSAFPPFLKLSVSIMMAESNRSMMSLGIFRSEGSRDLSDSRA